MFAKTIALASAALLAVGIAGAQAGTYNVTVSEGLRAGAGFDTTLGNPFSGANTASATFTYTGPIAFVDTLAQNSDATGDLNSTFGFSTGNISGYSGTGIVTSGSATVANYNTLAGFLASSGSASSYQWGSYYTIDLGVLAAGTVLTITHDDGASVYQNGVRVGTTAPGPTQAVIDVVALTSTADTILRYSRQNGTPSILTVSVPEPVSMSLLGAGLIGLGVVRRRRG